jgi:uncharacterized protein (DUF58 family)
LLTRKLGLVAAFVLWILLLAMLLGSPPVALAAVPVALYLAFVMLVSQPHLDVAVARLLPSGQVYEGERVTVTLRVKNEGPRVDLEVIDGVPPEISVSEGSNHVFAVLGEGECHDFTYTFSPESFGTYTFGPIKIRSSDMASARYEEMVSESHESLRVYPKIEYLNRIELRQTRPRNWPGETSVRRPGQGLEFYGIGEYHAGDPLRRVNWRASARAGHLMLNQFMNEAGGETVLVLDLRSTSRIGTPPNTCADYSVRAAAALSQRLLRDRNRVGLLAVGQRIIKVPPGFGRRQFERILVGLISTKVSVDAWNLELVPYYLSLFYSRMVQLVLISPLVDSSPVYMVSELARRGYEVLVVSPSPLEIDHPEKGDPRAIRIAKELATMERDVKISSLRRHAKVIDWNPNLPLVDAFEGLRESWRVRRLG